MFHIPAHKNPLNPPGQFSPVDDDDLNDFDMTGGRP